MPRPLSERPTTPCVEWRGDKDRDGYGVVSIHGRANRAHRIAYLLYRGPLPSWPIVLDHLCENRACINPDHLDECHNTENVRRSVGKRGARTLEKTHCRNGHPYEGANILIRKDGWRRCRACQVAGDRARHQRNRPAVG